MLLRDSLRLPATLNRRRGLEIVVARSALRFKPLNLGAVPPGEQMNAARSQALAWSPFEDSEVRFAVAPLQQGSGVRALLLAWDRRQATARAVDAGLDPARLAFVPEPLRGAAMPTDGLRLLRCEEGFEGQRWQGRFLCASRWWPELPSQREWQLFEHAAGIADDAVSTAGMPAVSTAEPARRSWARLHRTDEPPSPLARVERLAVTGLALALLAASVANLRQELDWRQVHTDLAARRDQLTTELQPLLARRQQALGLSSQANGLAARLSASDPLDVLSRLAAVLPREGVLLKEFVVEGDKARVVLEANAAVSRASLVTALQARGAFTEVAETSEGVQRAWVAFNLRPANLQAGAAVPTPTAAVVK